MLVGWVSDWFVSFDDDLNGVDGSVMLVSSCVERMVSCVNARSKTEFLKLP